MSTDPPDPSTPVKESNRRRLNRSSNVFNAFFPSPKPLYAQDVLPLNTAANLARFEKLAQGMQHLQQNVKDLEKIHCALDGGFNEPFAGFLYGLLLNMFCSNYPACPSRELYEAIQRSTGALSQISSLEERIRLAKMRRSQLQQDVAHKTQELRALQARKPHMIRKPLPAERHGSVFARPNVPQRHKKVVVARDDTFSTNDSFVETPITDRFLGPDSASRRGPNLNQAPRFMRGLFESPSASSARNRISKPLLKNGGATRETAAGRAERARRERLSARPPFR